MLDQRLNKESCETPAAIVDRLDLRKVSFAATADSKSGDECDPVAAALKTSITEVLSAYPSAVEDFRKGKKGAFNFLIGQLMKKTRGCADPGELNRLLKEELERKEV
jgi:aspartyl-tRNA(Asn)/glutamyl-tRNA(Gln) amidotransferase subunit B